MRKIGVIVEHSVEIVIESYQVADIVQHVVERRNCEVADMRENTSLS